MPVDPYAAIATPTVDPYAALAQPAQSTPQPAPQVARPGAVRRFTSSFLSTMGIPESVQNNPSEALQGIKLAVQHPDLLVDSLKEMGNGLVQSHVNLADQGLRQVKRPGIVNKLGGATRVVLSGVPLLGPALQNSADQLDSGNVAGAAGSLTALAAPMVAGSPAGPRIAARTGEAVTAARTPFKGVLAPRMAEPIAPGEALTRADVVKAAQDNGVNLNLASATGVPVINTLRKANQYTLGGSHVSETAANANSAALGKWADTSLRDYSPIESSTDTTGQAVRAALIDHQQSLAKQSGAIFDDLGKRNGTVQPDMTTIVDQAKAIVSENADYYLKNPDQLTGGTKRAWETVSNLAERGQAAPPKGRMNGKAAPLVDTSTWDGTERPAPTPDTLADLFKMRSDHMNEYRSPDIAGSRAEGWMKQLVGATDGTIMDEMGKLSPGDQSLFREGNALYSQMKDTYDNPQHPFYHAVRGPYDAAAANVIGNETPGVARDLRSALNANEENEGSSPRYGQVQRQVLQNILDGMSKDGVPDFKGLDTRVGRRNPDYLRTVLGSKGADNLQRMGKVGNLVTSDSNASGTAKVGVPASEIFGLFSQPHIAIPEMAGMYGLGRFLQSPKVLDYLTKPRGGSKSPVSITPRDVPPPSSPVVLPSDKPLPTEPAASAEVQPAIASPISAEKPRPIVKIPAPAAPGESVAEQRFAAEPPKFATRTHPDVSGGQVVALDADTHLPIVKRAAPPAESVSANVSGQENSSGAALGAQPVGTADSVKIAEPAYSPRAVDLSPTANMGYGRPITVSDMTTGVVPTEAVLNNWLASPMGAGGNAIRSAASEIRAGTPQSVLAKELAARMASREEGSTTLYRGSTSGTSDSASSWTSDPDVAARFGKVTRKDISNHQIAATPEELKSKEGEYLIIRSPWVSNDTVKVAEPARLVDTGRKAVSLDAGTAIPGEYGNPVVVKTASGDIAAKYKIVEADALNPSHDATTFAKNPGYPEGVQERAYHSSKEAQNRVIQQAQNYDPAYTVNTNPDAVNGPPVVTEDGTVLGGNSRTMATQRLYSDGDPTAYRAAIKDQAQQFGLNPDAVDGFKNPVLVREVPKPATIEEARRLGSDLNKNMTGALGVSERAVTAGKSISPETMGKLAQFAKDMGDGATMRDVLRNNGKEVMQSLVEDGVITSRERPQFMDTSTGGLSEEGKTFVERALRGLVVDDPDLYDRVPKSVMGKIDSSLPDIMSVGTRTDGYNLLPLLREALSEHAEIAAHGSNIDAHLGQVGMFADARNPAVDAIVRKLGENPKEVRMAMRRFAADAAADQQGQSSLLMGGPQPSTSEAFNDAFGTKLTDNELADSIIQSIDKHANSGTLEVHDGQAKEGQAQPVADDLHNGSEGPAQVSIARRVPEAKAGVTKG